MAATYNLTLFLMVAATLMAKARCALPPPADLSVGAATDVDSAAAALCSQNRNEKCDWSTDNVVLAAVPSDRLLNAPDEPASGRLADGYRSHVRPRFAIYETSKPAYRRLDVRELRPASPFAAGWSRYSSGGGSGAAFASRLGFERPNGDDAGGWSRFARPLINGDNKRAPYAFSSWGGKRSLPSFAIPYRLRESGALQPQHEPPFTSRGNKRTEPFFNWGGKRGLSDGATATDGYRGDDNNDDDGGDSSAYNGRPQHAVMKRQARSEESRSKKFCQAGADSRNWRQLFNEFVEWSRKQPEQKKASFYKKLGNVKTLHSADSPNMENRRSGAFYPWGGKRNSGQLKTE